MNSAVKLFGALLLMTCSSSLLAQELLNIQPLIDRKMDVEARIQKLRTKHIRLDQSVSLIDNYSDYAAAYQELSQDILDKLTGYSDGLTEMITIVQDGSEFLANTTDQRKIKLIKDKIEFDLIEKYKEAFIELSLAGRAYEFYKIIPSENIARALGLGFGYTSLYVSFWSVITPGIIAGVFFGTNVIEEFIPLENGLPVFMNGWKERMEKDLKILKAKDVYGEQLNTIKNNNMIRKANLELAREVFKNCETKVCISELAKDYKSWIDQSSEMDQKIKLDKKIVINKVETNKKSKMFKKKAIRRTKRLIDKAAKALIKDLNLQ